MPFGSLLVGLLALGVPENSQAGEPELAPPKEARRLDPKAEVWVDAKGEAVYVGGQIANFYKGVLEMFACPTGTKEHESVVAVNTSAMLVHTALLSIGAEPGAPVQFDPEYRAPHGDEIEVRVQWLDKEGKKQTVRAQQWVRHSKTGKEMKLPFVFAGSGFLTDFETGRRRYLAERGDMICVSNFGTAMLDVPAPSTQSDDALWFEPFVDRIPATDTPVLLVLKVAKKNKQAATKPSNR